MNDLLKTPAELAAEGKTLPCGFSLKTKFLERLRHYRSCEHAYCQQRAGEARKLAGLLAAGMKRQKEMVR
jgi:hypothetical protein